MTWFVAGASPHRLVGIFDAQQNAVSAGVTNTDRNDATLLSILICLCVHLLLMRMLQHNNWNVNNGIVP
jgi:hypothetical protein